MVMVAGANVPKDAEKPNLYDLAEGYGSIYGRYVRKRLCQRLIARYGIRTVLEAPCNAECYFASPGTQSVVFAEQGCAVTLLHPQQEVVRKTREFWAALHLPNTPVIQHEDLYHLPFADGEFDLVWNFDYLPLFADPPRFAAEMVRVSKRFVLVIVANRWNVGYPLHSLFNLLGRRRSVWGSGKWMATAPVERTLRSLGMGIVERGLVDMPPWPGFDVVNVLGRFLRRNGSAGAGNEPSRTDADTERMLHKLTFIEYAPLPGALKVPFSHQLYILACK